MSEKVNQVEELKATLARCEEALNEKQKELNDLTRAALESLDWSRPIESLVETLATSEEIEEAKRRQRSRRWIYVLRLIIMERLEREKKKALEEL